jgi:CheY-like chemotaxis protein
MSKRILVVDDSALVRKDLTALLEGAGYEVDTARNGQDGYDKAVAENFDAITMDINMPVMDGITAVEKIMSDNPTPILMVSSLTTEDAQITFDAMDLGAVAAVGKPGTMKIGGRDEKADILEGVEACLSVPRRRLKLGTIKRNTAAPETESKNEGKKALYTPRSVHAIPGNLMEKYFQKKGMYYELNDDIKGAIHLQVANVFDKQDMRKLGKFDIIFSRNMLIYFDEASQKEVAMGFYNMLNPGGFIFLGHAEHMSRIVSVFKPLKFGPTLTYQK